MNALGNKEIMARNLRRQMDRKGIDRVRLSEDLGIPYTTISDWLKGKTYPRIDKIERMAGYFGVDKVDLIEDQTSSATRHSDNLDKDEPSYYLDPETAAIAQEIHDNPELRALFSASRKASPESLQAVANLIKSMKNET